MPQPATPLAPHGFLPTRYRATIVSVALTAFLMYSALSVHQWANFHSPSWDLGIFTQLVDKYAHLQAPIVDIKSPGYNLLGDHFHPILILLAPLYRLFPSGLTLLIAQNALFALSSIPLGKYATKTWGLGAGVAITVASACSWGLHAAVIAQFHEIAFAVPLLAFGLVAWLEGRYLPACLLLGALVFVKEEMGLTLLMFPLVTRIQERRRPSPWALGLAAWGAAWALLSIFVILPAFNAGGSWDYYDRFSGDNTGMLAGLTEAIFTEFPTKIFTLITLTLTAGVIGVISPYTLLLLPTLGWRFLGNVPFYWGTDWHYSAILMPIVFVCLMDAGRKIRLSENSTLTQSSIVYLCAVISFTTSLSWAWSGNRGLVAQIRGKLPSLTQEEKSSAHAALNSIPPGAHVVTDIYFLAYAVPGRTAYWEGTAKEAPATHVLFSPNSHGFSAEETMAWAQKTYGGTWEITFAQDGYVAARRA